MCVFILAWGRECYTWVVAMAGRYKGRNAQQTSSLVYHLSAFSHMTWRKRFHGRAFVSFSSVIHPLSSTDQHSFLFVDRANMEGALEFFSDSEIFWVFIAGKGIAMAFSSPHPFQPVCQVYLGIVFVGYYGVVFLSFYIVSCPGISGWRMVYKVK